MDIRHKHVLVLGGAGLVGSAVCAALVREGAARVLVGGLTSAEAREGIDRIRRMVSAASTELIPIGGNVFVREALKDKPRVELLSNPELRRQMLDDVLGELSESVLASSYLARLIRGEVESQAGRRPDIIVDCINTATVLAYQEIYAAAREVRRLLAEQRMAELPEAVEALLCTQYTPQLVRHVQILYEAMRQAGTQTYLKVGTSGTGGMGLNIPYTHGEEKPSRVLMSKSAMAGAHSLLLFLMARTPGAPVVKEVKPAAVIAWKTIAYGPIKQRGQPIPRFDCSPASPIPLPEALADAPEGRFGVPLEGVLESIYIDTGENGMFSLGEFAAITTLGQMEFITPEEIAATVIQEIKGGSTGADIVGALDAALLGPTYRAGVLRIAALTRLRELEKQHRIDSVAFEILGPPRLSKLLYEAYLLKRVYGAMKNVLAQTPERLALALWEFIKRDDDTRVRIISIGLPILLPDGARMLRGPRIKSQHADAGWVDLTPANLKRWQDRLKAILAELGPDALTDSSSRIDRRFPGQRAWAPDDGLDIGEIAGWLFIHEDGGERIKR
ncbi:MAG TPA: short-chain dehydrogenase [Anaerolineae bacterium]|nr:short-chain dehydrogenase [Anaerolineae bacterium]